MPGPVTPAPAIVVLGASALETARRIQRLYPEAQVHGLRGRADEADMPYENFGEHLRDLYRANTPIIALCAAGIMIRSLAPVLGDKDNEPPVLVVGEDGSAVVPLLGGLAGVNRMAREIAAVLEVSPAITTSGELRFGACLLSPPPGYVLGDLEQGKRFVSDLLAGAPVRVEGPAPWLDELKLPLNPHAKHRVTVSPLRQDDDSTLSIHPRQVSIHVERGGPELAAELQQLIDASGFSRAASPA